MSAPVLTVTAETPFRTRSHCSVTTTRFARDRRHWRSDRRAHRTGSDGARERCGCRPLRDAARQRHYLRNPLNWDRQVHWCWATRWGDLMRRDSHSCVQLPLPKAASMLHDKGTQRLIVVDEKRCPVGVLTRGDVVRASPQRRLEVERCAIGSMLMAIGLISLKSTRSPTLRSLKTLLSSSGRMSSLWIFPRPGAASSRSVRRGAPLRCR